MATSATRSLARSSRVHSEIHFQPGPQSHRASVLLSGAHGGVCWDVLVAADAHSHDLADAVIPLMGEIKPETYLSLLTMHGTIMVFFVLTTAPQGGFGNYFLPIQIGAPDMAFPVLNMLSFWTTFVGFVVILAAFFVTGGAPLHGWTGYPPLSALRISWTGRATWRRFMDHQHRDFLYRFADGGAELHHHHP